MIPDIPSRIACIGSRRLSKAELDRCHAIGAWLAHNGHTVISGAAEGADLAFMRGASAVGGKVIAFLPWKKYNELELDPSWQRIVYDTNRRQHKRWRDVAKLIHPAWDACSGGAKAMHARNTGILLGEEPKETVALVIAMPPSDYKDLMSPGGTSQGIRLATARNIPVINLREVIDFPPKGD